MNNSQKKILVIEDESVIRESFTFFLEDQGFSVQQAENGRVGIDILEKEQMDLVLTDLRMPELGGLDVLKYVKEKHADTPVIVISGNNFVEDAVKSTRLGAWDYLIKPIKELSQLGYTVEKALEKARLIQENNDYKDNLEEMVTERTKQLERKNHQLKISHRQIIGILSQAAEYRDFETGKHFLRVSEYSSCIARGMGMDENQIQIIQLASPVHDIGKIGIPDSILLKNGKLDSEEWSKMKEHCQYGKMILTTNKFVESFCKIDKFDIPNDISNNNDVIETAANIALNHHEYWDGNGYPSGLKGENIPIESRITSVADVFDALSSHRPYKDPWTEEKCLNHIKEQSGKQFDPAVVKVFMENLDTIRNIKESLRD